VDVSKLFRQTAQASTDFTSGWATGGKVDEAAIKVVPLQNLVGKRFYHKAEAHQVVDYGPLDEASYRVKNLVSEALEMLPAEIVERASVLPPNAPLTLHNRRPRAEKQPTLAPAKTDNVTPLRKQYLDVKQQFPNAILFFRLGDFYEAFDADAEIVARELDVVLTSRNTSKSQRVPMAGVPHHAAEGYIARLIEKGYHVAVCEQVGDEPVAGLLPREVVRVVAPHAEKQPAAEPPQPAAAYALPATLEQAYARFRETQQPGVLTFVEMPDAFISFEGDAIAASHRLHRPHGVRALPGGPSLQVLTLPRGGHEAAFARLRKGNCPIALVNGRVEVLAPEPRSQPSKDAPQNPPLSPRRSPEQLREMAQGQLALF
jgi:hypothetical protein